VEIGARSKMGNYSVLTSSLEDKYSRNIPSGLSRGNTVDRRTIEGTPSRTHFFRSIYPLVKIKLISPYSIMSISS
jgi:hypothetical protein